MTEIDTDTAGDVVIDESGKAEQMSAVQAFALNPILNSPYEYPKRHWEMDESNLPTQKINEFRRPSSLKSPIVANRRRNGNNIQGDLFAQNEDGVDYSTNDFINSIRAKVDEWRSLPQEKWGVTPETIAKHPGVRTKEIATHTGKSIPTVSCYIKTLKDSGKIKFRGAPKTGGYFTSEERK